MSGTFPASPAPSKCKIRTFTPSSVSSANSLRSQRRSRAAHQWQIRLSFATRERADIMPIFAFIAAQRGQFGTFQYVIPRPLYSPQGVGAAGSPSPIVNNQLVSPTEDYVGLNPVTSGWTPSVTILKAGDFVKFSNHSKVYMQTEDVASNGSGVATLTLNTPLIEALTHGAQIVTHNIPFTVALANDDQDIELVPGPLFEPLEVELLEAF